MRALRSTLFVVALIAFGGCGTMHLRNALEQLADSPSHVILYSLEPTRPREEGSDSHSRFHGFAILGSAELRDLVEQKALLQGLAHSSTDARDSVSGCFNPRHGLHVEQAGRAVDLVICFECDWIEPHGLNQEKGFFTSKA